VVWVGVTGREWCIRTRWRHAEECGHRRWWGATRGGLLWCRRSAWWRPVPARRGSSCPSRWWTLHVRRPGWRIGCIWCWRLTASFTGRRTHAAKARHFRSGSPLSAICIYLPQLPCSIAGSKLCYPAEQQHDMIVRTKECISSA
jgi:hypothetical protein